MLQIRKKSKLLANSFRVLVTLLVLAGSVLPSLNLIPIPAAKAVVDTCTWDGSASGLWNTAANWSCSVDGEAVPENGDSLIFPGGAANLSMNNDIVGLSVVEIDVNGSGYTFDGNGVTVTSRFDISVTGTTIAAPITFSNGSASTIFSNAGTTTVSDNFVLSAATQTFNLIGAGTVNFTSGAIITGTAGNFNVNGTVAVHSTTTNSTFTVAGTSQITGDAIFYCNANNCLGAAANDAGVDGTARIVLNTDGMTFPYDFTFFEGGFVTVTGGDDVIMSGDVVVTEEGSFQLEDLSSLALTGEVTMNGDIEAYANSASNEIIFDGVITTGTGGNILCSEISCFFTDSNPDFDGVITASDSAAILPTGTNSLGSTVGGTVINEDSSLSFEFGGVTFNEPITLNGVGIEGSGAMHLDNSVATTVTVAGPITLAGNTLVVNHNDSTGVLDISGAISGTGDLTLTNYGAPAEISGIILSGSTPNTYSGTTYIEGLISLNKSDNVVAIPGNVVVREVTVDGTLKSGLAVESEEQIANTALVTLTGETDIDSAILAITPNFTETVGGLTGTLNSRVSLNADGSTLIVDQNSDQSYEGEIAGDSDNLAQFIKRGTGTLRLTGGVGNGVNVTFITEEGVLSIGGDFETSESFEINGGTLSGLGTPSVVNSTSGKFAPGASPGMFAIAGDLNLSAGTTYEVEIAGATAGDQYDQVVAEGVARLNNAPLNVLPTYTPAAGTTFTIVQATTVEGTFADKADGSTFIANGIQFRINYILSDSGDDTVVLTYLSGTVGLPNSGVNALIPAAALGVMLAIGGGYALRRRYAKA